MSDEILDAALAWFAAGACVLPAATDATKRPGVAEWRSYQHARPSDQQLLDWFANGGACGMGVVCGQVSGNLEMTEFESSAMTEGLYEQVAATCRAVGLGELWERVVSGYREASPTGGVHLFWHIIDGPVPGNTKIARRPATEQEIREQPDNRIRVLIETRGEGGWVVTAPSNGRTHPLGLPWRVLHGSPADIATITSQEREELVRVMRSFDQMTSQPPAPVPAEQVRAGEDGLRPGDDFEARTTWPQILQPHGWTQLYQHGGTTYWRRPGKRDGGQSATTGYAADRDRLWVFSSATGFDPERPYTKFGAYALLNHGGDHAGAARALAAQGFGDGAAAASKAQADLIAALAPDADPAAVPVPPSAPASGTQPAGAPILTEGATEVEVADWLVHHYAGRLRYEPHQDRFYHWDGTCWAPQPKNGSQFTIARIGCAHVPAGKARMKWGSASAVTNVKVLLERHAGMHIKKSELDPHSYLLNTPAGVVDLRTGHIGPHDPTLMCTRITTAVPDPLAQAPRFRGFLCETFGDDEALMSYVQMLFGYTLFGHNDEQLFIVCHGDGGNGKSLLLDAIMWVLGTYANKGDSDWLMVRSNGTHTEEIAAIEGIRMMYFSEIGERNRLDERRVKELSGGERIRSRKLFKEFDYFEPICTMVLIANELPRITQGGDSLFRRIRSVPFTNKVDAEQIDVTLAALFRTPQYASAILNWLIAGAVRYANGGFPVAPPQVLAAGQQFREEAAGPLAQWVADRVIIGGGNAVQTPTSVLYQDYQRWCSVNGIDSPIPLTRLSTALKQSFAIETTRSSAQRFCIGASLVGSDDGQFQR